MSKKCCGKKKPCIDTRYTSFLCDSQQNSLYTHFLQGPTSHIVCKPGSLPEIPTGSMVITDPNRGVGYTQLVQASTQQYSGAPNPLTPYVRVGNSIIPSTNNTYDLGAAAQRFRTGYFGSGGIDISGLVITVSGDTLILPAHTSLVNGALLGSGGGSGSSSDLGLEWINKNLIGKSPIPQIGTVTVRSSEIYIPWTYPDQIRLTFMDAWVPGITALNATLEYVTQNASRQATILQKAEGENYVDLSANRYTRLTTDTHITGIILTSTPGTPAYVPSVTFPDGSVRNVYRFYHSDFVALTPGSQFILNLGYSNFGTPYDTARLVIDLFKPAGPPSAPRNIQQSTQQAYAFTVVYQAPQFVDISDALSTAVITGYTIKYSSSGAARRYPAPLPTADTTVSSTTLDKLLSALTPDSTYAITITATNSAGLTGAPATAQFSTAILSPPPLLTAIQFNLAAFNTANSVIKRVSDGSTLTSPLLLTSATGFSLQAFQNGIHSLATRGNTDTAIATVEVTTNGKTAICSYNGFPATTPTTVIQDGITIQSTGVVDMYATTDPATGSQGFYLMGNNAVNVDLAAADITPAATPYTISVIATQSPVTFTTSSLTFYYDNYPTIAPAFLSATASRFSSSTWSVSGVQLVSAGTIIVNASLQNMGRYFYREPMVTITNNFNLVNNIITITDVTSGKYSDQIAAQIDVEKVLSLQLPETSTTYTKDVEISLIANNPETSTTYGSILSVPLMIDMPSYTLVYGSNPYYAKTPAVAVFNTQTTGVQTTVGYRISSGTSRGALGLTDNPYVTEFEDPIISYDHTANITATEELQISQGKYRSRINGGYENYQTTFGNSTVDYSTVIASGYRFATFYWDFTGFPNNYLVIALIFRLQGLNRRLDKDIAGRATVNGKRVQLYYRFVENLANPTPSNISVLTTSWINGNNNEFSLTSENYISNFNNTISFDGLKNIDNATDQTECMFDVKLVRPIKVNCRLYCRVGLPMDESIAFRNLSASIIVE